ncbi:alpha/beta hydrolase fold domain-containing protein [Psychrobacter celer]|uniref:alpha/beta hydrolase n=1 Tax=Psychrobacter TaxID=497 RepID=UPI000ED074CB|nr:MULTISPECIES: alpha/beta hydrolase [Psychrobacter]HCH26454.1 lipase [Psychrobacter sp.]
MSHYQKSTMLIGVLALNLLFVGACSATTPTSSNPAVSNISKNKQKSRVDGSSANSETLKAIEAISESQLNVPYKTLANKTLAMDIYLPKTDINADTTKGHPLAIWVHGGGWKRGDKADFPTRNPNVAKALLEEGYVLASINYRLSSEAQFPAPLEDSKDAVQFLLDNAKSYGIDPNRMVIMGRSAGGHLATLTATQLTASKQTTSQSMPKAVISFFGLYDLLALEEQKPSRTSTSRKAPESLLLGNVPSAVPELAKMASPINFVTPKTPPTLLMHGVMDKQAPVKQSLDFAVALEKNNVPHKTIIEDKARHSDPIFDSKAYVEQVMAFLKVHNP